MSSIPGLVFGSLVSVRWFVSMQTENGKVKHYYRHIGVNSLGSIQSVEERSDLRALEAATQPPATSASPSVGKARQAAEGHPGYLLGELRGIGGRNSSHSPRFGWIGGVFLTIERVAMQTRHCKTTSHTPERMKISVSSAQRPVVPRDGHLGWSVLGDGAALLGWAPFSDCFIPMAA